MMDVLQDVVWPDQRLRIGISPPSPNFTLALAEEEEEEEEGSGESSGGEAGGTKTITSEEAAPASYICLGYIFSIIAGFCFTSW